LKVTVLDEGDVAYRAARGNFGLVWIQSKGAAAPAYARLSRLSAGLWPDFVRGLEEDTGIDIHFEQRGGLMPLLPEDDLDAKKAMMAQIATIAEPHIDYEIIDGDEARRRQPCLGPEVTAACYSPADGHVNPLHLLRAMHVAIVARGGSMLSKGPVRSIARREGGTFVIEQEGGERTEAARVVVAAGLGSEPLAAMIGMTVPVMPQRGQILVTARLPRMLDFPTLTLRQTDNGSMMVGESWEDAGFDDRTTPAVLSALARRAVRLVPELRKAPVVRSWGALRVLTPDTLPAYGQSHSHPGAFAITCHSGVTLAALHAETLARDIAAGSLSSTFDAFQAGRFDVH
jgi:glycine/D-amino acid oxidase-like deaminating enzyme